MSSGSAVQLKLLPTPKGPAIKPGQDSIWFTVLAPPTSDTLSKALADGTQNMFVFNIMRYQDDATPPGMFIYTESCLYFTKEVLHFCEGGHTRLLLQTESGNARAPELKKMAERPPLPAR